LGFRVGKAYRRAGRDGALRAVATNVIRDDRHGAGVVRSAKRQGPGEVMSGREEAHHAESRARSLAPRGAFRRARRSARSVRTRGNVSVDRSPRTSDRRAGCAEVRDSGTILNLRPHAPADRSPRDLERDAIVLEFGARPAGLRGEMGRLGPHPGKVSSPRSLGTKKILGISREVIRHAGCFLNRQQRGRESPLNSKRKTPP